MLGCTKSVRFPQNSAKTGKRKWGRAIHNLIWGPTDGWGEDSEKGGRRNSEFIQAAATIIS